jgi:rfaE bifunctional protein nucleotidyltransferase chain/domain
MIHSWEQARELAETVAKRGGLVVTTNGCFDLIHPGHVQLLTQARSLGDLLIVGINSEASVRSLKGPTRPLNSTADRAAVLAALRPVDSVCVFEEATPVTWLETIRPHIHVKGGDYRAEDLPEFHALKAWGGKISIVPFLSGKSTTSLVDKIAAQSKSR